MPSRLHLDLPSAPLPSFIGSHVRHRQYDNGAMVHADGVHDQSSRTTSMSSSNMSMGLVMGVSFAGGAGALVATFLIIVCFINVIRRRHAMTSKTRPSDDALPFGSLSCLKLQKYSYRELKRATGKFSEECRLGQGGFGTVYRAVLKDGRRVAVKRLDRSSLQGEREFQNEISVIGRLNSPQIVGLLGFCIHRERKLLVYELMENRSLQEALFDENYPVSLDWSRRFKIIVDTADALAFLHTKCDPPIIHGDIKPSNILLDENFSARIADFGLARVKSEVAKAEHLDQHQVGSDSFHRRKIAREDGRRLQRNSSSREASKGKEGPADVTRQEVNDSGITHDAFRRNERRQTKVLPMLTVDCHLKIGKVEDFTKRKAVEPAVEAEAGAKEDQLQRNTEKVRSKQGNACSSCGEDIVAEARSAEECSKVRLPFYEEERGGDDVSKVSRSSKCRSAIFSQDLGLGVKTCCISAKKYASRQWWRQETSEDFSLREYIVDWVACDAFKRARGRKRTVADKNANLIVSHESESGTTKKQRVVRSGSLEWWGECEGDSSELKKRVERQQRCRSRDIIRYPQEVDANNEELRKSERSSRMWWREDTSEDLNRKSKELSGLEFMSSTLEKRESVGTSEESFRFELDLAADSSQSHKINSSSRSNEGRGRARSRRSRGWLSGEVDVASGGKERWNGETPSCGRLEKHGQFSGVSSWSRERIEELCEVKEDAAGRRRRDDRSRSGSKDWWSGEVSFSRSGGVGSTPSMRGTICYIAPEYGGDGIPSEEGDVYSFGVLMLVVVSGRRPLQVVTSAAVSEFERANLISWARHAANAGRMLDIVDANMQGHYSESQVALCISVALHCLQRLPAVRPTMVEVVKILTGQIELPKRSHDFSPSPPSCGPSPSNKSRHNVSVHQVSIDLPLLP